MRAILIDPEAKTITEVEYDGDYKTINKLIGVDLFTVVTIDRFAVKAEAGIKAADESCESIFVDDEGLLNDPKHFFLWKEYPQPLAGKGLILGCDPEGESVATTLSLEYVKGMVSFTELSVQGFKHEEGEEDIGGHKFFTIKETPIFGPPDDDQE